MVDRTAILAALQATERIKHERTEVWRALLDLEGKVVKRIYRGIAAIGAQPNDHLDRFTT